MKDRLICRNNNYLSTQSMAPFSGIEETVIWYFPARMTHVHPRLHQENHCNPVNRSLRYRFTSSPKYMRIKYSRCPEFRELHAKNIISCRNILISLYLPRVFTCVKKEVKHLKYSKANLSWCYHFAILFLFMVCISFLGFDKISLFLFCR